MAAIVRPKRPPSFSQAVKATRGVIPADQLDSLIHDLVNAITSTQDALADLRRDDGQLRNGSIGREHLKPDVAEHIALSIYRHTQAMSYRAEQGAAAAMSVVDDVDLRAKDAEAAAISAAHFLSAIDNVQQKVNSQATEVASKHTAVEYDATQTENWAEYSKIQAQNAEAQQEQAAAWAEYLAGPCVNSDQAPAYIQSTPWGHGLYYQPVEGGVAGLWSAKWWALYAQQLVGAFSFYYLGGWHDPPLPGSSNPDTGRVIPDPIPPGSFYYDLDSGTVYFWDGDSWESPYALASGVTSRFVYKTTAGQTVFTGADMNSAVPVVGSSPSDVHLNGVKLVPTLDYTIAANTLTLTFPATVDSYLQWDLLVPPASLVPGAVNNFKVTLTGAVDGTNRVYTMTYVHPVSGVLPVAASSGVQLLVSLDGIIQEPGTDYTANGNTLTMANAPPATAHFWAVWFANAAVVAAAGAPQGVKAVVSFAPGVDQSGFGGELGAGFYMAADKTFAKVGLRCGTGNHGNRTVKLYEWFTKVLLRTVTIDMTGKTPGDFVYADIPPTTLSAFNYYALVLDETDGQVWANAGACTTAAFVDTVFAVYRTPPGDFAYTSAGQQFVGVDLVTVP